MKDTASRIRIGLMTFVSLSLACIAVFLISRISWTPKQDVRINFSFINSLEVRAPVRFAGARVGEVRKIHVLSADERAEFTKNPPYVYVIVSVDKRIKIPRETKAMVNTMGFMGEKYLELLPESRSTTYLDGGEALEGVDPTAMDSVFASAKKLSDEMQIAAKNMNTLTTEMQDRLPVLIGELEKTLASAQDLAGDAKHLTGNVQSMVDRNRDNLEHLLANSRQMTIYMKSLSHVLARRPWKIIWGFGGPLPIDPENMKFVGPPDQTVVDEDKK